MSALTINNELALAVVVDDELRFPRDFAKAKKSPGTLIAYRSDIAIFTGWCGERSLVAWPASADTVAAFLAAQAGLGKRPSTLSRRIAAIKYGHKLAGLPTPTDDQKVKATLSGIRGSIGTAAEGKNAGGDCHCHGFEYTERLRQIRNRALFLVGFAGTFRQSELVALNAEDVEEAPEGLLMNIRRSKVDQEGGRKVRIPHGTIDCPVAALKAWMAAAVIRTGPLFRRVFNKVEQRAGLRMSGRAVAAVLQREAGQAGAVIRRQHGSRAISR
jgi:site-specific recombinase XerD